MQVLIAEDHAKLARLIQRGLHKERIAADVVGGGAAALSLASSREYDALVLDLMLPGMNGLRVCRALREGGVQVPILILSARDRERERTACLEAGADDYVIKPFSYAELLARLRSLIDRRDGPDAAKRVPARPK